ncbi:hypothetical protein [Vagococcus silagei]|uniref:Uncharacterized protein n=1 Tax=Vagococcus silagei TaxID=2508885 RepID=A0A4S3B643_9ENTE|nr:hypothetical protein ESZ54_05440 [Vagococcus silagei]
MEENILKEVISTDAELTELVKTTGFKEALGQLTDEAGNISEPISMPIFVYEDEAPKKAIILYEDYQEDYVSWLDFSPEEREKNVRNKGKVEGFLITETEFKPTDPEIIIEGDSSIWKPNMPFVVKLELDGVQEELAVFLKQYEIKMTVKHVYEDTSKSIYQNLKHKVPSEDPLTYEFLSQGTMAELLENLNINRTYEGYDYKKMTVNGHQIEENYPVPRRSFELVIHYEGQVALVEAPTFDFDKMNVAWQIEHYALTKPSVLKIINSKLEKDWQLYATGSSMKNEKQDRLFNGELRLYQQGKFKQINDARQHVIDQERETLVQEIDFKGTTQEGLVLTQKQGNLIDQYSTKIVWSLESVPKITE